MVLSPSLFVVVVVKDIKGILMKFRDEIKLGSRMNMKHNKHDSKISVDQGSVPNLAW